MAVCLFAGYFWLRGRARALNLESLEDKEDREGEEVRERLPNRQGMAIVGVFGVLTGLLIGEKHLFDHWHFGVHTDLFLKVALTAATFAAVGFLFLKPGRKPAGTAEAEKPPAP